MELRHLRYFEAVAAERNFTRAALRLGVAQPPLSRQIKDLEQELEVELFDRGSRPIRLTEAGRVFREQVTRILTNVEQLRATMRQAGACQQRRFVVGVVGSIMHGGLPEIIRRFRRTADVECALVELTTLEQGAALREGRIDAGLGRVKIDHPAIRRDVLYEEPLIAAVAADHPLARRTEPLHLTEFAADTLIVYPSQPRPSYADQVLDLFRDHGTAPLQFIEVREVQTALGLVAAESGIALVPFSMRHLHRGDIVYRQIAGGGATSPIIHSQRLDDESEETRLFLEIARSVFAKMRISSEARLSGGVAA